MSGGVNAEPVELPTTPKHGLGGGCYVRRRTCGSSYRKLRKKCLLFPDRSLSLFTCKLQELAAAQTSRHSYGLGTHSVGAPTAPPASAAIPALTMPSRADAPRASHSAVDFVLELDTLFHIIYTIIRFPIRTRLLSQQAFPTLSRPERRAVGIGPLSGRASRRSQQGGVGAAWPPQQAQSASRHIMDNMARSDQLAETRAKVEAVNNEEACDQTRRQHRRERRQAKPADRRNQGRVGEIEARAASAAVHSHRTFRIVCMASSPRARARLGTLRRPHERQGWNIHGIGFAEQDLGAGTGRCCATYTMATTAHDEPQRYPRAPRPRRASCKGRRRRNQHQPQRRLHHHQQQAHPGRHRDFAGEKTNLKVWYDNKDVAIGLNHDGCSAATGLWKIGTVQASSASASSTELHGHGLGPGRWRRRRACERPSTSRRARTSDFDEAPQDGAVTPKGEQDSNNEEDKGDEMSKDNKQPKLATAQKQGAECLRDDEPENKKKQRVLKPTGTL